MFLFRILAGLLESAQTSEWRSHKNKRFKTSENKRWSPENKRRWIRRIVGHARASWQNRQLRKLLFRTFFSLAKLSFSWVFRTGELTFIILFNRHLSEWCQGGPLWLGCIWKCSSWVPWFMGLCGLYGPCTSKMGQGDKPATVPGTRCYTGDDNQSISWGRNK